MNTKDDFKLLTLIRRLELLDAPCTRRRPSSCWACGERNTYRAGETAWLAGDTSSHILVLLSGLLRVVNAEGQQIGQVSPDEVFGEMGVLTGHIRFAGIEAVEPPTALSLADRASAVDGG